jgi:capsular polysaccharide biosynthesis protein
MILSPHSRDVAEYGSVLRRRWQVFLSCLFTGMIGGAVLLLETPAAYTSAAQVQVFPTGMQEQVNLITPRQKEPLNLDTESQIAQSTVVASIAAQTLKYTDPEGLREMVEVDVPPNSAILSISFTTADPESAAKGAQAFADAYLRNRYRSAMDALAAEQKVLAAKLRQVNTDLGKAAAVPTQAQGSAARAIAAHRQTVLAHQASSLTVKYDALKTVAITPGTVISSARPPAAPSAPSAPIYLGSGLFLGLLCGTGAAFARDRLDTRLRRSGDVERLTGLPLLAEMAPQPETTIFHELAAVAVTALGDGYHTLLLEELGDEGHDRSMARGLGAALAHLAPISVVTGRGARPDAAMLLAALGRTTSADVAGAVRHLTRQGVRVLGVVAVLPGPAVPVPDQAEQVT